MQAADAYARRLTAQQVLDKVVSTYSSLKAVHMVAEREETTYLAAALKPHFRNANWPPQLATAISLA
jgi:hypothetical protein